MTLLCLTLLTSFLVIFIFRVTLVSQVPGETQEGMENGYELSFIVQRLSLLYFYKRLITGCAHMKSSNSNINTKKSDTLFLFTSFQLDSFFWRTGHFVLQNVSGM